jgi:hypothetical protein
MKFGGFMGLEGDLFPIPWELLKYDVSREAYITEVSEAMVKAAPRYDQRGIHDKAEAQKIHSHYDVPFYWEEESPIAL